MGGDAVKHRQGASAESVGRGELPALAYDIYCPAMGGERDRLNYLASSCENRLRLSLCSERGCARRKVARPEARVKPALRLVDEGPLPVMPESKPKPKSKKSVRPCAECTKVMTILGRGLCCACYQRLERAGTLDRLYPAQQAGRKRLERVEVVVTGELARRLRLAAEKSGQSPAEEALVYVEAYLNFLGVA